MLRRGGALLLPLLLVACGSTARFPPNAGEQVGLGPGEEAGSGIGADPAVAAEGGATGPSAAGSSAQGTTRSGTTAGSGPGRGSGGRGGGGSGGGGGTSSRTRGVTNSVIRIGIEYSIDSGSVGDSFKVPGVAAVDWKLMFGTLVDDVNARGGIHGRKLDPVYFGYRFDGDWSTQEGAACTKFTQDVPVFAVVAFNRNDLSCYEKAGLPQVTIGNLSWFDDKEYADYPHLVTGGGFSWDRTLPALADNLHAQGFFGENPVIGVVSHEGERWDRIVGRLKRELARYGLTVAKETRLPEFRSANTASEFSAAVSNGILRFRQPPEVNRVLFVEQVSIGAYEWMSAADGQQYRPRYGLTSNDQPVFLAESLVSKEQLRGALGLGFAPTMDVGHADDPGIPGQKRCLDMLKEHQEFKTRSDDSQGVMKCGQIWTLEEALRAGGPDITSRSFLEGLRKAGTTMQMATTFASNFGTGRRDGAAVIRRLAFVEACSCFRYTSGDIAVP